MSSKEVSEKLKPYYKLSAQDQRMFGFVDGVRAVAKATSKERALQLFASVYKLKDFNVESELTRLRRIEKLYFNARKST